MRKGLLFGLVLSLCLVSTMAFTQAMTTGATMTLKGTIIDNMCTSSTKDVAVLIKTHTKDCALMPDCVKSGYSIYADGKLHKFDAASNAKIETFLKVPANKLNVVVTVKKTGDVLSLVSIENQK